jgi:hypothetical protein
MKKVVCNVVAALMMIAVSCPAQAEGLLNRDSGELSDLQEQELDSAYERGYNDAKSGRDPVEYNAGDERNKGEVARGAGRGALGGAAMGSLSGGDAGRGAAWGAGMGAAKSAIKRKRAAEEERMWADDLNDSYNKGYHKGMTEGAAKVAKPEVN